MSLSHGVGRAHLMVIAGDLSVKDAVSMVSCASAHHRIHAELDCQGR